MDLLEDQVSIKGIRHVIENLPLGLNNIYQDAWLRIQKQSAGISGLARQTIYWLSCAYSQITIDQLRHAIATEENGNDIDKESLPATDILIAACQGLVKIDEQSGIIRLAHYTTYEFFVGIQPKEFPDAHQDIAKKCLSYLDFDVFNKGPCKYVSSRAIDMIGARGEIDPRDILARRIARYPFMTYAVSHWADHARRSAEGAIDSKVSALLNKPEQLASILQARYIGTDYPYDSKLDADEAGSLTLHAAVCFNLESTVNQLLKNLPKESINGVDCRGKTALHWAIESRSTTIALRLLQAGADLETSVRGERYQKVKAIVGGVPVFEYRVGDELDDAIVAIGDLVYICVKFEQPEVLRSYIVNVSDTRAKRNRANNVLLKASLLDKSEIVELAISCGGDINANNEQGHTALAIAVGKNHLSAVLTLTSYGALTNVKYDPESGRDLIQGAVEDQHVFEQRLAIIRNNFEIKEPHFGVSNTVKKTAANDELYGRFKNLVSDKPIWPISPSRETHKRFLEALHEDDTQVQIIEAILDHGADLFAKAIEGDTLLHLAICSAPRLEALLKRIPKLAGALDINTMDSNRRTPLHYAAAAGNASAMRTLLAHGADIKAKDKDSAMPLHFAAETHECISVALEFDVVVDATDSSGRTVAHYLAMLANDPDPNGLTPWQREQMRPGPMRASREERGKKTQHFSSLPRECHNTSLILIHDAYKRARINGRHAADMYGYTMSDYCYATRDAQRGFKETETWLKEMKGHYKLRTVDVEKTLDHAIRQANKEEKFWTMDRDQLFGWGTKDDGNETETLEPGKATASERLKFQGDAPEKLDSRHIFLVSHIG
ncbi:MAG: hypothetical protein Q9209_004718 [Squamulea sp. 1 TL-2023]